MLWRLLCNGAFPRFFFLIHFESLRNPDLEAGFR